MKKIHLSHNKDKKYKSSNLGLHCHCAENKEFLLKLLEKAKQERVKVLVINNYKSLRIFTKVLPQLSAEELEKYRDIKVVPSIELPACFNFTNVNGQNYNFEVHILGYGLDVDKEELLERFCEQEYKTISQEDELQRLIKIGHELGLNFKDEDAYLDPNDDNRKFAGRAFTQALMKNMDDNFCREGETNSKKLPFELRTNWRAFQNRCVKDINSPFYLDLTSLNPSVEKVIDLIHQMGGKAYLAHPSAYFSKTGNQEEVATAFKNVTKFAKDFLKLFSPQNNPRTHIDGAEIYHPSYLGNLEVMSEIRELIKQHRIGSSGGTDIHVDKTLNDSETVSSDSIGGHVIRSKLVKFHNIRKKAISMENLVKKLHLEDRDTEGR